MATGTFACAINCIDGRTQLPVINWLKTNSHVDYIDMVTMPGADNVLSSGVSPNVELIRDSVEISVRAHASSVVAIAGHHECAAFPVSHEAHFEAIRKAMDVVASWGYPVRVIGLYVNDQWLVEEVS